MARIEFGGNLAARLALADAFQPARHRRMPGLFINQLFGITLQRLPFQQADPVAVLAGGLEPEREAFGGIARQGFRPGLPLGHFQPQHFAE